MKGKRLCGMSAVTKGANNIITVCAQSYSDPSADIIKMCLTHMRRGGECSGTFKVLWLNHVCLCRLLHALILCHVVLTWKLCIIVLQRRDLSAGEVVGFLFLHSFASEMNHCGFYYLVTSSTLSGGNILE